MRILILQLCNMPTVFQTKWITTYPWLATVPKKPRMAYTAELEKNKAAADLCGLTAASRERKRKMETLSEEETEMKNRLTRADDMSRRGLAMLQDNPDDSIQVAEATSLLTTSRKIKDDAEKRLGEISAELAELGPRKKK